MSCNCKCAGAVSSKGPKGDAGESAYSIAVSNGFVGTEADWLASLVGEEFFEDGSGLLSLQTKGNGADASGENTLAIGVDSLASGDESCAIGKGSSATKDSAIAIGNGANSDGVASVAIGDGSAANGNESIAIGLGAQAIAVNSTAIGNGAISNIGDTTNISGCIITRKDLGEGDPQLNFAGAVVTITTEEIDLKSTGVFTITVPSGTSFFLDETDLIITSANTVTVQPQIRIGITGTVAKFLAIVTTTGLTAALNRQRFQTMLSNDGVSTLRAEITTAATATTMKGRFVFRGLLIENE